MIKTPNSTHQVKHKTPTFSSKKSFSKNINIIERPQSITPHSKNSIVHLDQNAYGNSKLVQDIAKRIRELELQKINYMEQKFRQTNKDLILKQKKAKKNLVQVYQQQLKRHKNSNLSNRSTPKGSSCQKRIQGKQVVGIAAGRLTQLRPWGIDQQNNYYIEDKQQLIQNIANGMPLPSLNLMKKHNRRFSMGAEKQNENSIPKLKCLLKKLEESPEKRNVQYRQKQKNDNLTLDVNQKKQKYKMNVDDFVRIQDNPPINNNSVLKSVTQRTANTAGSSGNDNVVMHNFIHYNKKDGNVKQGLTNICNYSSKQNEMMIKLIKQKRQQQNKLMMTLNENEQQQCRLKRHDKKEQKSLLKRQKFKERLTLLKLLS